MAEMEKAYIEYVLKYTKGNQVRTARYLGLNRSTLLSRMKKLGVVTEK